MQKKSYTVNYGDAVTVFPKKAAKKIIKGEASLDEIRVLTAFLASDTKLSEGKLCAQTGLDEDVVSEALCFWRGVGVISCSEKVEQTATEPVQSETVAPVTEEKKPQDKKILISRDMPKYSGLEISAMLDKDGGKLREMIDTCQQLLGHIFTPTETNTVLGLCGWLGLEAEYVVTLVAYYTEKKPGCNVRYIEKAAIDLVNDEITSIEALDAYIREMELYDGVAGGLRSLIGIGGRAFTKKENDTIRRWTELGYGFDVIKLAYEACCDSKTTFSFDYTNKIIENWYKAGVKTAADAENELKRFKEQKKSGTGLEKSFDTTEFFATALSRSYKKMADKS